MVWRSLQALPDWLNQKWTRSRSTYTRSAQPVPFRSARNSRLGSKSTSSTRRVRHGDPLAEAAVAEVGPVVDAAVVHQDDVVQTVAGHVGQADPPGGIVEKHIGELVESWLARDATAAARTPARPDIQTRGNARRGSSAHQTRPSPVRSTSRTFGVGQVETGRHVVRLERLPGSVGAWFRRNPASGPELTSRSACRHRPCPRTRRPAGRGRCQPDLGQGRGRSSVPSPRFRQ